jgi:nucleosome assembly protein 1-like 1
MNEENEEYDLEKSESTTIEWKQGKKITHELTKKKQKHKKTKEVRYVEQEHERESFFNIFKT